MRTWIVVSLMVFNLAIPSVEASGKSSGGSKTVHVSGYTRKDGTYVQPYVRSSPGTGSRESARTEYRSSTPIIDYVRPVARVDPPIVIVNQPPPAVRFNFSNVVQPQRRNVMTRDLPPPVPIVTADDDLESQEKTAARLLGLAKQLEIEANQLNSQGRIKEAEGVLKSAKSRFADIVKKYPRTAAAQEASEHLKKLR